ncbi:hypothetical protein C5C03_00335 [Clavibacter michiganensis]|nr:hypothetical protein C5C03_00335 [Clavibacter michiganensis]PPF99349.1 hypothetical protein C5C05_02140 [Clavibacter michiganensis]
MNVGIPGLTPKEQDIWQAGFLTGAAAQHPDGAERDAPADRHRPLPIGDEHAAVAVSRAELPVPGPADGPSVTEDGMQTELAHAQEVDIRAAPKASIVRWTVGTGGTDVRDRLLAYSSRERYTMQELMIRALRIGMDEIEKS